MRPWLFGILFRVAADHHRLFRQTRELLPQAGGWFDPEDPAPLPDDALLDRQARAFASQALDGLDVRLRSVLEMHDLGGRAVPEIAEALQIPVKTVYTPLARRPGAAGQRGQPPDDQRRLNAATCLTTPGR